jgi:hypothetical protein
MAVLPPIDDTVFSDVFQMRESFQDRYANCSTIAEIVRLYLTLPTGEDGKRKFHIRTSLGFTIADIRCFEHTNFVRTLIVFTLLH